MNFVKDKKFIISLERRLDRRAQVLWQMQKHNFTNYEIVDAIDGGLMTYKIDNLTNNQIACLRSHLKIVKQAKKLDLPYVTILEDDCDFVHNFQEQYTECINELPNDWDMFYIGCNNTIQPNMVSNRIGRCISALTTVAYVVRKNIYDLVIEQLGKEKLSLDQTYVDFVSTRAKVYCAVPNLCSQMKSYSDIEKQIVDYSQYYK